MPRYEGTDHNHASYKRDVPTRPDNLAAEALADAAAGRPTVGTASDDAEVTEDAQQQNAKG